MMNRAGIRVSARRRWSAWALALLGAGCVPVLPPRPAALFTLPLVVEGVPVGDAIVDTGGAYELILRDDFGLERLAEVQVLAFGGVETVAVTHGFHYAVEGIDRVAGSALIGLSTCDCNGVGFGFFRQTGGALEIDFLRSQAALVPAAPTAGVRLEFVPPPPFLSDFDSSFIEVVAESAGRTVELVGLLDTGSNGTFVRRGIFANREEGIGRNRLDLSVTHAELGTVVVNVGLFDTDGLPDVILGTDVMRAWGPRWYFTYHSRGGHTTAIRWMDDTTDPVGPAR